jgi:serine/threonine protein kinase/Tfp pilus assembly protein PilF
MGSAGVEQLKELFHLVRELPPEQREEEILRRCAGDDALAERLRNLLQAHDRAEEMETIAPSLQLSNSGPKRIDSYRIVERLGEGGMGVVFIAEQVLPVRRRVALKVLKSGLHSKEVLARFHAEQQAMALMSHPNIARILDAGVFEDRPYFVMEYIPGVPITRYCDRRNLSIEERLRLFIEVCQGVQHAHQKGVIHRDLKPSNILIADDAGVPIPKIIDFGIAKAISGRLFEVTLDTEFGRLIGTPDYMSPEQADLTALDIDTRTDVYSLGALLYELLTGTTVFDLTGRNAGIESFRRCILEETPTRPSVRVAKGGEIAAEAAAHRGMNADGLARTLREELDWITLRALEKDRVRRYPSASELAADVRRYLEDEPIAARAPTTSYRIGKFVRRNRLVVGAASLVAVILIAATIVSTTFVISEHRHRRIAETANKDLLAQQKISEELRRRAETERDHALALIDFLNSDLLAAVRPSAEAGKGREVTMREALDVASERIEQRVLPGGSFADKPVIEASIRANLGAAYHELSIFDKAEHHLARSYRLYLDHLPPDDPTSLDVLTRLGPVYYELGRNDDAERYYREAVDRHVQLLGPDDEQTLAPIGNMGIFLRRQGRLKEAEPYYRRALDGRLALHGEEHRYTLAAMDNLGALLHTMERREEAAVYFGKAVEISKRVLGPKHPSAIITLTNYGDLLAQIGRTEEGILLLEEAIGYAREVFGPEHVSTATPLNNYAMALKKAGRIEEAAVAIRECLEINRKILGENHANTVIAISNLAGMLRELGDFEEAVLVSAEAVQRAQSAFPQGHWAVGVMRVRHAESLLGLNRFAEAEGEAKQGHGILEKALGSDSDRVRDAAGVLARVYQRWNDAEPSDERATAAALWLRNSERLP